MITIIDKLEALIRDTSSSIPDDVTRALMHARRREGKGSSADVVLGTIMENCSLAKRQVTPICQDTGTLTFYVDERLRRKVTREAIQQAVARATAKGYLRKNTIDGMSGRSYDDNCAEGAPVIHYVERTGDQTVTLLMKGGGSENMSRQYSLPDASIGAGRDLAGVRLCVLDAVRKIQGYGCAPGVLGVCIGGDRATGYEAAKEQLLRSLDEKPSPIERSLLWDSNRLGVGPMGLGGKTSLLGVKVTARPRVPASYFVTIAYMCWACRRRTIVLGGNK